MIRRLSKLAFIFRYWGLLDEVQENVGEVEHGGNEVGGLQGVQGVALGRVVGQGVPRMSG